MTLLQTDVTNWQRATFPNMTLKSVTLHQWSELQEAFEAVDVNRADWKKLVTEIADCGLLCIAQASLINLELPQPTVDGFENVLYIKLRENKTRKWAESTDEGFHRHVKAPTTVRAIEEMNRREKHELIIEFMALFGPFGYRPITDDGETIPVLKREDVRSTAVTPDAYYPPFDKSDEALDAVCRLLNGKEQVMLNERAKLSVLGCVPTWVERNKIKIRFNALVYVCLTLKNEGKL